MARYKFTTSGDYIVFSDGVSPVVTLHNTSRDVEWRYDSTGGMTWEIDGKKFQTDDIANIEFDGVACNSQDDFQTGIEAMFPDFAGGGTVVGYPEGTKMYLALLTQTGTDAPVATVLVNTLGGTVSFTRDDLGYTLITSTGLFTINKTLFFPSSSYSGSFNTVLTSASQIDYQQGSDGWVASIQILVLP